MSSLSDFLGEIGRHELLTPEQELTMGRKVQAMVALNERCQILESRLLAAGLGKSRQV